MPSFSFASSMIGRILASWAIWMSVFGLVCCVPAIERFLLSCSSPHVPFPRFGAVYSAFGERRGEGALKTVRNPLSQPLPLAGERRKKASFLVQVNRAPTASLLAVA